MTQPAARAPRKAHGARPRDGIAALVRRGEVLAADCPSREVLQHVTSRWGVLLLVALMDGMHRFSDLRRKVGGVSEKMLAQSLKALEADGFVLRHALPTVPPHVEYTLTPLGEQVAQRVESLVDWIEENVSVVLTARRQQSREAARRTARAGVTMKAGVVKVNRR